MKLDDRQVAALLTAIGDDALDDGRDAATLSQLFERVRTAALAARPAGRPFAAEATTVAPVEQAIDVYRRQVAALDASLDSIPASAWESMTDAAWTVHELIAHLVTVEEYLGSVLGLWSYDVPEGTEADHRKMTELAIAHRITSAPVKAIAEWRARVHQLLDAIGESRAGGVQGAGFEPPHAMRRQSPVDRAGFGRVFDGEQRRSAAHFVSSGHRR